MFDQGGFLYFHVRHLYFCVFDGVWRQGGWLRVNYDWSMLQVNSIRCSIGEGFSLRFRTRLVFTSPMYCFAFDVWCFGGWILTYFGESLLRLQCFRSLAKRLVKCVKHDIIWSFYLDEYFVRRIEAGFRVRFYCDGVLRLMGWFRRMTSSFTGSRFCSGWKVSDGFSNLLSGILFSCLFAEGYCLGHDDFSSSG